MNLVRISPSDNVAIALTQLPFGTILDAPGIQLSAGEMIPAMHKVALVDIDEGSAIIKFGQVVGYASCTIAAGAHVHTHNCVVGEVVKDYGFCLDARETEFVGESECATFQGYRRAYGGAGTRNYVGVLTTVNCSATVARAIAAEGQRRVEAGEFPNVDGVIALTHSSGCGMRGDDDGYHALQRTINGHARHPNFGAVMLVGLGCETMQVTRLLEETGLVQGEQIVAYNIQDSGGTRASIDRGVKQMAELLAKANSALRETIPAGELTLAVQCGGSDAFSGITANPALGVAGDILIRHGGSVIYSETPEIYGAEHLLTRRAASPEVAEALLERIRWWESYTEKNGFELNNNPSPGNKAGGLTTILEKSLGAQAKSGSTVLTGVYHYAERVSRKGLAFMDSPGFDPVSVTGQVASGANVICFTTGRGSAFGYKPVPSIKLSTNSDLYARMAEDIDLDCGGILTGAYSVYERGMDIFQEVLAVASGKQSKSEILGYGDCEFTPWKIGATV